VLINCPNNEISSTPGKFFQYLRRELRLALSANKIPSFKSSDGAFDAILHKFQVDLDLCFGMFPFNLLTTTGWTTFIFQHINNPINLVETF
jgi:hypothetical protein